MKLRLYQREILSLVLSSSSDDLIQLETGAGKTPIEASLAQNGATLIVAHRQVLIKQISEKLAAIEVPHSIIAMRHVVRACMVQNQSKFEQSFVAESASVVLASLDSLMAQQKSGRFNLDVSKKWQIIVDEAHHACEDNKWGKLLKLFPNRRLIGFTATPARLDGKPLGKSRGGLFDSLIQAPSLGSDSVNVLIAAGYLSKFKVYSLPDHYQESYLVISKKGDYTASSLSEAIRGAPIADDAVAAYKRICPGSRAVAMCVGIRNAEEVADQFRSAGIASASLGSHLSASEISMRLEKFASGEIKVLASVDMISEGFDLPEIEAVILLRKTASFVLYRQWIGRALRPSPDKKTAYVIDHAGNVARHGMPDERVKWDIDTPPRRASEVLHVPCEECDFSYPIHFKMCPECGHQNRALDASWPTASFYINQKKIDERLVEKIRRQIEQKMLDEKASQVFESELILPASNFGFSAVGSACTKILAWFAEQMKGQIPYGDLNRFLARPDVSQSFDFWVQNFTIADTKTTNPQKALRAYKKWLKSH